MLLLAARKAATKDKTNAEEKAAKEAVAAAPNQPAEPEVYLTT